MIILVVTWQVPIVGVLMALGGVVTWLVVPVVRLGKYLMLEPELHRKRGRAWVFTGAVATAVLLLVGVIPFPRSIYAAGVVEPKQKQVIRATQPGRVVEIKAKDGQPLKKDDIILICRDWELEAEIEHDLADFDRTQAKLSMDQVQHPAMVPGDTIELAARRQQLEDAQRRKEELTIRAPFDGYLVAPELINLSNRYLERGMEIANVATTESLLVKATILQQDGELAIAKKDKQVEVRLVGRADEVLNALSETVVVLPGTQPQIPAAVSTASGGSVQTDPRDQSNTKPMIQQFELQAVVANPNTVYMPGQGARVRLKLDSEPLYKRWVAKFFQLVRSHQQSSKWL
jgi:putative peptide zinc metalloprotease protein